MTAKLSKPDIDAEARAWFVRLLQEPTARNRATFEAWRQADPAHAEAFRAVALTWEAAEQPGKRLAEAEADELSVYLKAMDGAKDRRKSSRRLAGAAVILACLLGTAVWLERPNMLQDFAADYVSSRGERLEIRLADGSTVLLDADSALADDFSEGERQVRLLRGGAFFEVQHDPQHPFKVIAADGEVRVLGTRFEVRLLEDSGLVTLEQGSVSVTAGAARAKTVLEPGQQVAFGADGLAPVQSDSLQECVWRLEAVGDRLDDLLADRHVGAVLQIVFRPHADLLEQVFERASVERAARSFEGRVLAGQLGQPVLREAEPELAGLFVENGAANELTEHLTVNAVRGRLLMRQALAELLRHLVELTVVGEPILVERHLGASGHDDRVVSGEAAHHPPGNTPDQEAQNQQ